MEFFLPSDCCLYFRSVVSFCFDGCFFVVVGVDLEIILLLLSTFFQIK